MEFAFVLAAPPKFSSAHPKFPSAHPKCSSASPRNCDHFSEDLENRSEKFSSIFLRKSTFSGKCLLSERRSPAFCFTFPGARDCYRMHANGQTGRVINFDQRKFAYLLPAHPRKAMEFAFVLAAPPKFPSAHPKFPSAHPKCSSASPRNCDHFSEDLENRSEKFSSIFLRKSTFSGKCLLSEHLDTRSPAFCFTFPGARDCYRMHAKGQTEPSDTDTPEFQIEEILKLAVPEPKLSYRNLLTSPNSKYTVKSRYQTTRDLRVCSEKLDDLYKIHKLISVTGDIKKWNKAYKDLVNGLRVIMDVRDLVVEHKNDIDNLKGFLALPLNPATSDHKELPIFVPIISWKLKHVIIEEQPTRESSLKTKAKAEFGRKISVVSKTFKEMKEYLA